MKISYDWLKRYLPDLQASPEELENTLPMLGFEVDSITYTGMPPMPKVVVGEVLKKEQHPDADRLSVCEVKVGPNDDDTRQIVCGATNFKEGDRIPVALVGACLPGDFKIKKSKLRGVKSMGMMCSPKELSLSTDSQGLMILRDRPEVGTPINEVFPESTAVFDIELTANRGDCASHIGIARELAAFYSLNLQEQATPSYSISHDTDANTLLNGLEVNTENCSYYTAWTIKGIKVAPSPDWLRKDLEAIGLRSVNNVVDITNWILMDTGQPLHTFDLSKIDGAKINVRQATEGEKIKTLDDKEHTLDPSMMVIADSAKPLVVAGIMGSLAAEVDNSTVDIVLEAAHFNPSNVRATSRKLNLHTDSSYRFARDVDPAMINIAAQRAIELILELAGGEFVSPALAIGQPLREARHIELDPQFVIDTLGFEIETSQTLAALLSLGFHVDPDVSPWNVTVPTFRADLERPIDLVEEVLRLHGTTNIPSKPVQASIPLRKDNSLAVFNDQAADYLTGQHFCEAYHYTLRSSEEITLSDENDSGDSNKLDNPLTSDQTHFRTSLIPGLLEALKHNHANHVPVSQLFEIGHTVKHITGKPNELISVAFVVETEPTERKWLDRSAPDFYFVKNIAIQLASLAAIDVEQAYELIQNARLWQTGHSVRVGDLGKDGYQIELGLLNLRYTKEQDIISPVLAAELHILLDSFKKKEKIVSFESFSSFPPSSKDLALVVDAETPAETVRSQLEDWSKATNLEGFCVESVKIFDVYQGKGLGENEKSLAFSVTYRAPDRTLKDKEVMGAFDALQAKIKEDGRFAIRS